MDQLISELSGYPKYTFFTKLLANQLVVNI